MTDFRPFVPVGAEYVPDISQSRSEIWHFWMVDDDDWDNNQALCAKAAGLDVPVPEYLDPGAEGRYVGITFDKGEVTCQGCKELIHA